jgi:cytochrome c-type biogenesis protein
MESSNITLTIAFIAGLASFLSPYVLPLVPGYVSLISGISIDRLKGEGGSRAAARRAVLINSLAFAETPYGARRAAGISEDRDE